MKKGRITCLTAALIVLLFSGCSPKENERTTGTQIASPWRESTLSETESMLETKIVLPEGATVDHCQLLEADGLAEIVFTLDGLSYNYRIQRAQEAEDISGLYYDWMVEDDVTVGDHTGVCKRAKDAEETVDLVMWFDEENGLLHALSTRAEDLDGFDITAIAEAAISSQE